MHLIPVLWFAWGYLRPSNTKSFFRDVIKTRVEKKKHVR